jgi:hypothetical protein
VITVEFADQRIGRSHDVQPVNFPTDDLDALALAVHDHVRPKLASRFIEVVLDPDGQDECTGSGFVLCGFHTGARFTWSTGA